MSGIGDGLAHGDESENAIKAHEHQLLLLEKSPYSFTHMSSCTVCFASGQSELLELSKCSTPFTCLSRK